MYALSNPVLNVCYQLLVNYSDEMSDKALQFINNVLAEHEKGNLHTLTYKQMKWLGHLSKRHIQNDQYVQHDWWVKVK